MSGGRSRHNPPDRKLLAVLLATIAAAIALPSPAAAARGLDVGFVADQFGDDLLTNTSPAVRDSWFGRLKRSESSVVRINVHWNQMVGGSPPASPRNPNDPSYVFTRTDEVVRDAAAQKGLKSVLTVVGAPRWAEGRNPPSSYRVGSWKPNPKRLGQFAAALAKRYSGSFRDKSGRLLPRIRFYEAWNEPNLPRYLSPQWNGKKPEAPDLYRRLLNSFYEGVHSVNDSNKVIGGGTSPFGDDPGGKRMRPYYFWRELLCLKNRKKLKRKRNCAKGQARAHFDIYAHNPINAVKGKGPASKSPNPDDGVPSNFGDLGRIVRKAEQRKTILPKVKGRPGWATEIWYESNPPDRKAVSLKKQARFMQQALYVLWRQRASAVFFLQMRDSAYDPAVHPLLGFQTGVYFFDGSPKPSLTAVRFPFVVDRKTKRTAVLWGKAPKSGMLKVVSKGRGSGKVAKFRVKGGEVFKKKVRLPQGRGKRSFQARVGSRKSLYWEQK